ncbi:MAG: hypothetical protein HY512_01545 [Candidatus Aenigmarchaeota archaeon]|nr:hypothetical protein [Candidatus Aenigmarchaeota archaeon]
MPATLRLKEEQIPLGVRVHIWRYGAGAPDVVDGSPVVFRRLLGGMPQRPRMYIHRGPLPYGPGYEGLSVEGVESDVAFSPVECYSPSNAPAGRRYAVLKEDGDKVMIGISETDKWPLNVTKSEDGTVYVYQFPIKAHSLMYQPSFAHEVRMVGEIEDGRLLEALPFPRSLAHFMLTDEMAREAIVEALSRKYRNKDSNHVLIKTLQEKNLGHLLHDVQLPEGSVLVPLD